ncbi:Pro-kumamolisin, activation domain-containing protein [Mycena rebaudengoi]|nr:Pro-kumamolisin, activation domain-containing protein [Mycena rebaudengoi]
MAFSKLLSILLLATAAAGRMVVHESRLAAPAAFVKKGAVPADQEITLRFALTSNDLAGLQNKLKSVSTPGSPEFRRWLTKDQVESCVKSFVQPSAETVGAFNAFASANGLKPSVISPNGDWVSLTLPVSQANALFAANFTRLIIPTSRQFVEPSSPIVPAAHRKLTKRATVPASCDTTNRSGLITPICLQDLYGIPTTPATQPNNTLLVTAYDFEWAQTSDLQLFLQLLRPDIASNTTFQLVTLNGGENPQIPGIGGSEADLDVEYTVDGFPQNLLETTTFLDGVDNPPTVITTSYGGNEDQFGVSLATYMALGARGISIVFASGDANIHLIQCNNSAPCKCLRVNHNVRLIKDGPIRFGEQTYQAMPGRIRHVRLMRLYVALIRGPTAATAMLEAGKRDANAVVMNIPKSDNMEHIHGLTHTEPGAIAGSAVLAIWALSADTCLRDRGDRTNIDYDALFDEYLEILIVGLRDKSTSILNVFAEWDRVIFPTSQSGYGKRTSTGRSAGHKKAMEALMAERQAAEDADAGAEGDDAGGDDDAGSAPLEDGDRT